MEKFKKILNNILLFLAIFLIVNFIFESFQSPKEPLSASKKGIILQTTENNYPLNKTVGLEIFNNSGKDLIIANECPEEPFSVYRYQNGDWLQKKSKPKIKCEAENNKITIKNGEKKVFLYNNWHYNLFKELGRYRIEYAGNYSNEFIVSDSGLFSKLGNALFYKPIYNGLIFLTYILPNHDLGLAIILLTIIIRTLLLAPSQKAMKSQKKMQELQPRLEKIKEKHKGDQQRIAMETMAIWREAKINPFSSCLPILLQLPFLIAFFYVVQDGLNPDHTHLLYYNYPHFHLSDIKTNFFGILELTKHDLFILPLVVGLLQYWQMKLAMGKTQSNKQQSEFATANRMMIYIMPVMIVAFTASMPAGVGLYWGISTIYGIIQQIIVNNSSNAKNNKNQGDDEVKVKIISNS